MKTHYTLISQEGRVVFIFPTSVNISAGFVYKAPHSEGFLLFLKKKEKENFVPSTQILLENTLNWSFSRQMSKRHVVEPPTS